MRQSIVILSAIVVIATCSNASDKNTWYRVFGPDGNALIVCCKSAIQKVDDPEWTGTKQQSHDAGFCLGIVSGVADYMNSDDGVDLSEASLSRDQLVRVVEKYLEDHPEQLSKPASSLIRQAILKAFPKK
jgi:hypothetical protein